jgi:hypothetical protein
MASAGLKIKKIVQSNINYPLESIYFAIELIKMTESTFFGKDDGKQKI